MLPKRLYPCTKLNVVTSCNSVTLIFNVAVTLKSRVFLPCFSFRVQLTQSVYTHSTALNRHPQNVTAVCGEFLIFSERSAVAITWSDRPGVRWRCTHKERCVRCVLWCAVETQVVCQYGHFYVLLFRCSCCVLQTHLPSNAAADRQTNTKVIYCVCVCVCVCVWHSLTSNCYTNLLERCVLYIGRAYRNHPDVTFYIFFSTNISTDYFKHAAHSPFFSLKRCLFHNANFFGSCIIYILHTGCAEI